MSSDAIYNVILGAHISEKATIVADNANQFVFKVKKDATRPEIKAAVEKIYGVEVAGVTVANVKGKVKRTMRGLSRKPSWKKAYVRVADGQEIDFTAEAK
ncbi:MAG: 50S ribosomal protein L23 [Gammaproteobacteria bacterium TMED95]|jgi:large subunit ribosomal protein L23|nr:50S ribosomal protein L23 [Gammaproteobacteria bacterium]OUV22767.1 MAG: 50S ribosomal protein L23 [Gammaproteobacteria bacterium TMED95]|tara:strand:+ start:2002 stop:2301 length:300 start_codon:yes stop_codon:yes gene_type:complete